MTTATHPYYLSRLHAGTLEPKSTERFEHMWQLHAAVLDWQYSLPGYFSDREITRLPDGMGVAYGITPKASPSSA